MRKHPSRIFAAVAAAGLMASLSACQVKPGDYRIYKITQLGPTPGADCGVNVDLRDKNTFFGASTIAVFATDTDDFFLEYGTEVITGTRSGPEYSFFGESIQVDDPIDGTTITVTHTTDVGLNISGYKITGEYTIFDSTVCGGNCDGVPTSQCTLTGTFIGTEVKDVELERPI